MSHRLSHMAHFHFRQRVYGCTDLLATTPAESTHVSRWCNTFAAVLNPQVGEIGELLASLANADIVRAESRQWGRLGLA